MDYFENADSLTIESFLDLMVDLYHDVAEGIGVEPENCGCDDSDALLANLVWLGTQFRQICWNYKRDIAQADISDREQLSQISGELDWEIRRLQGEKKSCEELRVKAAAKEKEKRQLEGEIALLKQNLPELKLLENQVRALESEKTAEEEKWKDAEKSQRLLTEQIRTARKNAGKLRKEICESAEPQLKMAGKELEKYQKELAGLNAQIQLDDENVRKLKKQIEELQRDIQNSDKENILRCLNEKKAELEKEKEAIAEAGREIKQYEGEIRTKKEKMRRIAEERNQKKCEREELEQKLGELEAEFEKLIAAEERYADKKRRYNSLKLSTEQLCKDSAILSKRTGKEVFSLETELERAMSAMGNYLAGVEEAIKTYTSQIERVLQRN